VELYDDKIYLAEYLRRHGMTEEEHEEWLQHCEAIISDILSVPVEKIYSRQRKRKQGRQGQYQKLDEEKEFFTVEENGLKFLVNPYRLFGYRIVSRSPYYKTNGKRRIKEQTCIEFILLHRFFFRFMQRQVALLL
jgi:hypothetical protein